LCKFVAYYRSEKETTITTVLFEEKFDPFRIGQYEEEVTLVNSVVFHLKGMGEKASNGGSVGQCDKTETHSSQ
jgi:hypothetical protein